MVTAKLTKQPLIAKVNSLAKRLRRSSGSELPVRRATSKTTLLDGVRIYVTMSMLSSILTTLSSFLWKVPKLRLAKPSLAEKTTAQR